MVFMRRMFGGSCRMLARKVMAVLLAIIMVISASVSATAADISSFADVKDHWAYDILTRSVNDGIINGSNGKLNPNGTLTGAQMATILVRQTDSQRYDSAYPGTSQGDWYYMACAAAKYAGILPEDGSVPVDKAVTRAQVFAAFVKAFDLPEYNGAQDKNVYEPAVDNSEESKDTDAEENKKTDTDTENQKSNSSDSDKNAENMDAKKSSDSANDGKSADSANNGKTAEGVKEGKASEDADASKTADSANDGKSADSANNGKTAEGVKEGKASEDADASKTADSANDGKSADSANNGKTAEGVKEDKASEGADAGKTTEGLKDSKTAEGTSDGNAAEGTGNGKNAEGTDEDKAAEKTDAAEKSLKSAKNKQYPILDQFYDSGSMTTSEMDAAARLVNAGVVTGNDKGLIKAAYSITRAEFVTMLYRAAAAAEAYAAEKKDNTDTDKKPDKSDKKTDSSDVKIALTADDVKINASLKVNATVQGLEKDICADLQWYYDEEAVSDFCAKDKVITNGTTSAFVKSITFSRYMSRSHRVGLGIEYKDSNGDVVKLYKEKNVAVDNYSDAYYQKLEDDAAAEAARKAAEEAAAKNLLTEISCVYRGNYTKEYNKDYTEQLKTEFVNNNGYSSKTDYLVWVNLGTQKVNIFEGKTGNWKLIRTFRCASGAPSTPTPKGVTYVTYKQTNWTTSSYTCRPIVRFYPGTGYAFHSMLYYPRSSVLKNGAMGYPASHGCIRMEDEGIWFIYNYIPAKTTVVVY